jgi:hypothetical protein
MKLSASKFAEASGLSVVTIGRYCKNGRISAERTHDGKGWLIDPSELDRLNLKPFKKEEVLGSETPVLGAENRGLERLVATLQEQLADLRDDRDHWRQQAERLALLLPAPANAPPPEPAQPVTVGAPALGQGKRVGSFWARLWGKAPTND